MILAFKKDQFCGDQIAETENENESKIVAGKGGARRQEFVEMVALTIGSQARRSAGGFNYSAASGAGPDHSESH